MYTILLWNTSLYGFMWFFFIYSFLGWCIEVAVHAITLKKFVNRGFLNGTYCPIYGFGMILIVVCLTPIKDNVILLFLGAVVVTTLLELFTGFILEKFFHTRWWDYSNQKYNIKGYICLKYSIVWGIAAVVVMKLIHPLIISLISIIPQLLGQILIIGFVVVMIADFVTMIIFLTGMSKRMKKASRIKARIQEGSDKLGAKITDDVLDIQAKLDELPEKESSIQKRLEKAYPPLAQLHNVTSKEELRELLKEKIKGLK